MVVVVDGAACVRAICDLFTGSVVYTRARLCAMPE